ncbi:hypothetical protein CRG98_029720 [Punica granatum]|uniref:E3 ubiquitin-protein ligase APD1-4 N-terminal domain-containing protein n=1 Tax=Punica granatum TaxID=22663 RepID=A0A2I0J0X9_PUNGR|nr:hypothetical protein CRG98_029720 [Punica granatum]
MEDEASNGAGQHPPVPSSSFSAPTSSRVVQAEGSSYVNGTLQHQQRQSSRMSYRINISISDASPSEMKDDVWSCLVVLVTFWFFAASMTLILGFYGSVNLQLGPNSSRLIQTNPFFVQYIKEWMYFLNEGSEVDIQYGVQSSLALSLVVAKGAMTVLILLAFRFCNTCQTSREDDTGFQTERIETEQRTPLIPNKDDDLSSWGSSYDSVSHDEEDLEEKFVASSISFEGKTSAEGENCNNPRGLCAICFDSPRDCFFLPCGHCAACFDCGSRYMLAASRGSIPCTGL